MLESLSFENVGPAPQLKIDFHERLNFLAGDNGLGKSFLLDAAWWALTGTWARQPLVPHLPPAAPTITYSYGTKDGTAFTRESRFGRRSEQWSTLPQRSASPAMVIYAQVDGGFSVWDPARNYWERDRPERPPAYLFTAEEVWEGNDQCEGLIRDWASWQREDGKAFAQLCSVLETLSPSSSELLKPGQLRKVSLDDPRRHPTLATPYAQEVALIHASAGMRRIVALAYLLVWTWQEHLEAHLLRGDPPAKEIVFLIDEIEAHLHPQWQRSIVPALLNVMEVLTGDHAARVQLVAATHSPLVLASLEPYFDSSTDSIWELDLVAGKVKLSRFPWHRYGDVNNWLCSSIFDLAEPRSLEAEEAIVKALELLRRRPVPTLAEFLEVDQQLRHVLSGVDSFWIRWSAFVEDLQEAASS